MQLHTTTSINEVYSMKYNFCCLWRISVSLTVCVCSCLWDVGVCQSVCLFVCLYVCSAFLDNQRGHKGALLSNKVNLSLFPVNSFFLSLLIPQTTMSEASPAQDTHTHTHTPLSFVRETTAGPLRVY